MFISRRGQIPRRRDPRPEQSRLGPRGPGEGAGAGRRQLPERVQHGQGVVEGAPRQGAVLAISVSKTSIFLQIFANFWRARSRLYQNEILQENMRLTAFFKIYQINIII